MTEQFENYEVDELKMLYEALKKDRIPPGTPLDKVRAMSRYIRKHPPQNTVFEQIEENERKLTL